MSLKKNVLYNTFLTGANYIFPLITFPYISRVLGAETLGQNEFAIRIVGYFLLFASMGIATVGTREIAKCGDDRAKRSEVFSSILFLNLLTTGFVLLVYLFSIFFFPYFSSVKNLLLIGTLQIFFTPFLIEWLYKGVEDFPYITKRSLAVRVIYVVSLFIFVREKSDIAIYFLLTVLSMVLNALFNWGYKRKYVAVTLKKINVRRFIKPYFTFGFYSLLTSMYISFNVVFLGMVSTPLEVGYYSAATKLFSVILAFFTSFSAVMMPRMSNMFSRNDSEHASRLIYQSFELLFPISLTLILLGEIFAPEIIYILSGEGYEGAIVPMRIILPLIFVIGLEQILIVQILTPLRKDKAIFTNSVIGSIVGILLNFLLVPHLNSIGSALVWCCSELAVLSSASYFIMKYIGNVLPIKLLMKNMISFFLLAVIVFLIKSILNGNIYVCLIVSTVVVYMYVLLTQYFVLKNGLFVTIINKYIHR